MQCTNSTAVIANHFRLQRRHILFGVFVLAGVLFAHQFEPPQWTSLAKNLLRSLHGPGFAVLTLGCFWVFKRIKPLELRLGATWLSMSTVSLLAEVSQIPGPRNAEFADLAIDQLGIFTGLGTALLLFARVRATRRLLLAVLVAGLIIATAWPTAQLTTALWQRYAQLPVLLSFGSAGDAAYYAEMRNRPPQIIATPSDWPGDDNGIALGRSNGRWGTIIALDPHPDWRGYDAVSFLAAVEGNTAKSIGITIRSNHNVYRKFQVGPTPQRYTVTFADILGEAPDFDFANVRALVLSAANPDEQITLRFDAIQLETQASR